MRQRSTNVWTSSEGYGAEEAKQALRFLSYWARERKRDIRDLANARTALRMHASAVKPRLRERRQRPGSQFAMPADTAEVMADNLDLVAAVLDLEVDDVEAWLSSSEVELPQAQRVAAATASSSAGTKKAAKHSGTSDDALSFLLDSGATRSMLISNLSHLLVDPQPPPTRLGVATAAGEGQKLQVSQVGTLILHVGDRAVHLPEVMVGRMPILHMLTVVNKGML